MTDTLDQDTRETLWVTAITPEQAAIAWVKSNYPATEREILEKSL